jgi:hypothetical protein
MGSKRNRRSEVRLYRIIALEIPRCSAVETLSVSRLQRAVVWLASSHDAMMIR